MSKLEQLLESEEFQSFYKDNVEIVNEANIICEDFRTNYVTPFVLKNLDYFVESDLDTTYKNIRIFTEAAMEYFLTEINEIFFGNIADSDQLSESETGLNDYL
jgi:hypothetical protein